MGENKRPDLRRWLETMVLEHRCPGLEWEDKEEKLFRLPWPHQKSREWRAENCQIYIEWAKHTGRFKPGDPMDFPTWKTRIRTAINKNREIEEVPSLHQRDSANPYKVYRFKPTSPARPRKEHERASPTSTVNDELLPLPVVADSTNFFVFPQGTEQSKTFSIPCHYSGGAVKSMSPMSYIGIPITAIAPESRTFDLMDTSERDSVAFAVDATQNGIAQLAVYDGYIKSNLSVNCEPSETKMDIANQISSLKKEDPDQLPSDLNSLPSSDLLSFNSTPTNYETILPSINDELFKSLDKAVQGVCYFHVQVLYGIPGRVVNSSSVRTNRCRLFFGSPDTRAKADIEQRTEIQMPNFQELDGIGDDIKDKINKALFETEGGEVILTYHDGDIYAERRCLTRVFVSDGVSESTVLPRSKKNRPAVSIKIFDFNEKFRSEFIAHQTDPSQPVPKDFCYLTFGYEILKNDESPLRVVPVYVVVKHQQAVNFRNAKVKSIDSSKPLISNSL
ncbi:interferon regulatory factor 8 [Biomphalaria glabrata]|nr:interferon regulatory factor 8-like [Biomphalaria glabrata]